jgi:membrane protein CcdC involved in cytochrome C biogenesis
MNTPNEPIYLKKSAAFFKIYGGLILFSIIMSLIIRPLLKDYPDVIDLLVGLPIFPLFIMAPMGLFYSWKSLKKNEGLSRTRFKYFIGHLFFCALIILFIAVMISDFSKLF